MPLITQNRILLCSLTCLLALVLFLNLDELPLRHCDEARNALNAYEIWKNGNVFSATVEGVSDEWNTKPQLVIWLQVAGMKLLGINEWPIRLPSAFAGFLTCILVYFFIAKRLQNNWLGFLSALVLVTTPAFYDYIHSSRTGDFDAMVSIFLLIQCLSVFNYVDSTSTGDKAGKWIPLFFMALSLAIFSKGVVGLLFIPGLVFYLFLKNKLAEAILTRKFIAYSLITLSVITIYYWIRELYQPGFIALVYQNELGGRYLKPLEGNQHEFLYYLKNLILLNRYTYWLPFAALGFLAGCLSKEDRTKQLTLFSGIQVAFYYLIISASQTKLPWYDFPVFAILSFFPAILIQEISSGISLFRQRKYVSVSLVILILIFPYYRAFSYAIQPKEDNEWHVYMYEVCRYFRTASKENHHFDKEVKLYHKGNNGFFEHVLFYLKALEANGDTIQRVTLDSIQSGDLVLLHQDDAYEDVAKKFALEIKERQNNIRIVRVGNAIPMQ